MTLLPNETINDPQSLDAILVEMHKAYEKQKAPMAYEQSSNSFHIMMADDVVIDKMYNDFSKHYPFGGFFKRCEMFPIKYEKRLLVWLSVMYHELGIGGMILVAYYVQWVAYRELSYVAAIEGRRLDKDEELDLEFVCLQIFPFGIFTKETVHEFWDKQKVHGRPDNLIDYPTASMSFMKIERADPINSSDMVF